MAKNIFLIKIYASRYYYSEREKDRAVMVLGNFAMNKWRMSKSVINLDLNHILVAGRFMDNFHLTFAQNNNTTHKKMLIKFFVYFYTFSIVQAKHNFCR